MSDELKQMAADLMAKMTPLPEATDEQERVMNSAEKSDRFMSRWFTADPVMIAEMTALLDQHAAEQREACAYEAAEVLATPPWAHLMDMVEEACLNAAEKSDE